MLSVDTCSSSISLTNSDSMYLSKSLEKYGLKIIRLKTGTPPRILKSSIDFSEVKIEEGDKERLSFSNFYESTYLAGLPNAPSIYSENSELAEQRRLQVVNALESQN